MKWTENSVLYLLCIDFHDFCIIFSEFLIISHHHHHHHQSWAYIYLESHLQLTNYLSWEWCHWEGVTRGQGGQRSRWVHWDLGQVENLDLEVKRTFKTVKTLEKSSFSNQNLMQHPHYWSSLFSHQFIGISYHQPCHVVVVVALYSFETYTCRENKIFEEERLPLRFGLRPRSLTHYLLLLFEVVNLQKILIVHIPTTIIIGRARAQRRTACGAPTVGLSWLRRCSKFFVLSFYASILTILASFNRNFSSSVIILYLLRCIYIYSFDPLQRIHLWRDPLASLRPSAYARF